MSYDYDYINCLCLSYKLALHHENSITELEVTKCIVNLYKEGLFNKFKNEKPVIKQEVNVKINVRVILEVISRHVYFTRRMTRQRRTNNENKGSLSLHLNMLYNILSKQFHINGCHSLSVSRN